MLERRLADISGPFFDPAKPFRNWSSFPFAQIDLPTPPYIDERQLAWGLERAREQLRLLHAQGYTGVVIDNLAHLVGFELAPELIYAPNSPARLRARAYRVAFGRLFDDAVALGMEVFVTTDMQWSTPELRRAAGPLRAGSPRLRQLNRWAVEELFALMPQVRGLVVRVGEAGGAHDQGGDYNGHMIYTSPEQLRGLIADLLPVVEKAERLLIVRSWSLGIGELGDLVGSPERYRETFGGLRSPHLLVSVKHVPADFFRMLPPNPTIGLSGPRQIVELQNRREYELFGLAPSSVAELHQAALARAAANPQVSGIWAWNSTGGWGGGQATIADSGWNLWTALSSALTAALAQEPALDTEAFAHEWLRKDLGDPAFAEAVADLYLESAHLIEQGWYMGRLPRAVPRLGRISLTPLLWVWWMRPTVALPIWAYLADAAGDIPAVLRSGAVAQARAEALAERLATLAPTGDARATWLVTSARYLADSLAVAQAIRSLLLPLCANGDSAAHPTAPLRAAIARYKAAWAGRTDFPPLELDEIERFLARLERAPRRVAAQIAGARSLVNRLRRGFGGGWLGPAGAVGAAGLGLALLAGRPGSLGLGIAAGLLLTPPVRRRALQAALPWLSRQLNLLPSIFFEAGPPVGEWAR